MRTSSVISDVVKHKEHASIKELCRQSPLLLINTPCGVGRYRLDMLTYDNKSRLILKYRLIKDKKFHLLQTMVVLVKLYSIQQWKVENQTHMPKEI